MVCFVCLLFFSIGIKGYNESVLSSTLVWQLAVYTHTLGISITRNLLSQFTPFFLFLSLSRDLTVYLHLAKKKKTNFSIAECVTTSKRFAFLNLHNHQRSKKVKEQKSKEQALVLVYYVDASFCVPLILKVEREKEQHHHLLLTYTYLLTRSIAMDAFFLLQELKMLRCVELTLCIPIHIVIYIVYKRTAMPRVIPRKREREKYFIY